MKHTTRKKLRDYQVQMFCYAKKRAHFALFAEMRLGKTLTAIRIVNSYKENERNLVLIVAPFSAWDGWATDLHDEGIELHHIDGIKSQRLRILKDAKSGWYITNYEAWRSIGKELINIEWNVCILDESDIIKNPKAKVSKFFTSHFRDVDHRGILTGTPDPESDLDFYQQVHFQNEHIFKEKTFYQFRHNWCEPRGLYDYGIRRTLHDKFRRTLAANCFFIKRSDVNLGGKQIVQKRYVKLDSKHRAMYDTLEREFILESFEDNVFKSTMESFATYIWQRQLASGVVDGRLSWSGKVDELVNIVVKQLQHEQIVVWASFDVELYAIEEAMNKNNVSCKVLNGKVDHKTRTQYKREFQKGTFRILIIQPEIFKYGTDLSAASTLIYYSLPVSAKTYRQSKDRTIDIAKANGVLIIYLLSKDTVDEDICATLEKKLSRSEFNHALARAMHDRQSKRNTKEI